MFRIKTDIRQFNCETQEKVEKLIRNWVIRPTDLIYHTDDKSWEPIGDHPDFGVLFANLRDASDEEDVMTSTELDQNRARTGALVWAAARHTESLEAANEALTAMKAATVRAALAPSPESAELFDLGELEKLEGCVTCLSVRLRGAPEPT